MFFAVVNNATGETEFADDARPIEAGRLYFAGGRSIGHGNTLAEAVADAQSIRQAKAAAIESGVRLRV